MKTAMEGFIQSSLDNNMDETTMMDMLEQFEKLNQILSGQRATSNECILGEMNERRNNDEYWLQTISSSFNVLVSDLKMRYRQSRIEQNRMNRY